MFPGSANQSNWYEQTWLLSTGRSEQNSQWIWLGSTPRDKNCGVHMVARGGLSYSASPSLPPYIHNAAVTTILAILLTSIDAQTRGLSVNTACMKINFSGL
jgi:hypothetical protein